MLLMSHSFSFFFFNDTATTEIYTLSLHDALPIFCSESQITQMAMAAALKNSRVNQSINALMLRRSVGRAKAASVAMAGRRSEEHTSELQSQSNLVCRLLLEKKKKERMYRRCLRRS